MHKIFLLGKYSFTVIFHLKCNVSTDLTVSNFNNDFGINFILDDLDRCTGLWKSSAFWSFKGQSAGFSSLTEILTEEWFCRKQRIYVAIDICKLLKMLHDWKIIQEDLTTDDIFIKTTNQVLGVQV